VSETISELDRHVAAHRFSRFYTNQIAKLPAPDQARLTAAMNTIESLLAPAHGDLDSFLLRPHRPGDMGWVISRHVAFYANAHDFDATFEAFVADICAGFIKTFEPAREHCWIAELEGAPVGCVFVIRDTERTAKLRLLFVEPCAQRRGIGNRLVEETIRFSRQAGYATISLWTLSILRGARRVYANAGFKRVREAPHRSWGKTLVGETWALDL
jgi:GNAT superfamily N-acetyltransferase